MAGYCAISTECSYYSLKKYKKVDPAKRLFLRGVIEKPEEKNENSANLIVVVRGGFKISSRGVDFQNFHIFFKSTNLIFF